jgi:hypothetical protein
MRRDLFFDNEIESELKRERKKKFLNNKLSAPLSFATIVEFIARLFACTLCHILCVCVFKLSDVYELPRAHDKRRRL